MHFSQPATLAETPEPPTAAVNPAGDNFVRLAVDYALLLGGEGNAATVRESLPEYLRPKFDTAYAVNVVTSGQYYDDKRRKDEAKRLKRLEREVKDELLEEERREMLGGANEKAADSFAEHCLDSDGLAGIEPPEILVESFLVKESLVRLFGPPKSYKSFVALDMAGCIGTGISWHGKRVEKSRVLYIVAEGSRGIYPRVQAWESANRRKMTGVDFHTKPVQLNKPGEVGALIAYAKRHGHKFIVLDTQARCTLGVEENSNTDMGHVVAALDAIKEATGACVMLVHHSGNNSDRARGASAVLGALDAEFAVKADKVNSTVTITTKAQKDMAEAPELEMDLITPGPGLPLAIKTRNPDWYRPRPEDLPPLSGMEHSVLGVVAAFDGAGGSITLIGQRMADGIDKATVQEALGQLLRKGCIRRQGATWYIEQHGRMFLKTRQNE